MTGQLHLKRRSLTKKHYHPLGFYLGRTVANEASGGEPSTTCNRVGKATFPVPFFSCLQGASPPPPSSRFLRSVPCSRALTPTSVPAKSLPTSSLKTSLSCVCVCVSLVGLHSLSRGGWGGGTAIVHFCTYCCASELRLGERLLRK